MMNFAFLLNPATGRWWKRYTFKNAIIKFCETQRLSYVIKMIEAPGQGQFLAREVVRQGFNVVVAVGGDGTINDVARGLVNTSVPLGIIPAGSGNGFARGLGLPLDSVKACESLLRSERRVVDAGQINGEWFFNIAGVGLDASIASAYGKTQINGTRGIAPYFLCGVREYRRYRPVRITIRTSHGLERLNPAFVAVANGPQYGSGARIAPRAQLNDGLFDVVIVNMVDWPKLIWSMPKLFSGNFDIVPFSKTLRASELEIESEQELLYHIDGETRVSGSRLNISLKPSALTLWAP